MQVEPFEMVLNLQTEFDIVIDFLLKHDYQFHEDFKRDDFSMYYSVLSLSKWCNDDVLPKELIFITHEIPEDEILMTFEQFYDKYIDPPKDAGNLMNINNAMLDPFHR